MGKHFHYAGWGNPCTSDACPDWLPKTQAEADALGGPVAVGIHPEDIGKPTDVPTEKFELHTKPCPKVGIMQPHSKHTYLAPDTDMSLMFCPGYVLKRRFR